mgnify:CR=1 FL=1
MIIKKTEFKGLLIIKQKNNFDNRGSLRETFKEKILRKKFIFEYCTTSKKNVLRGFHFQTKYKQSKYVNVIKGKILDCVIDLRKNSKTFGKYFKCILSESNSNSIFIPPGFAHGFQALEKNNYIIYSCTKYRDSKSEVAIKFNDDQLKIKWPIKKPILSKKDKNAITFKEFIKKYL